jgi:hypothetical protein
VIGKKGTIEKKRSQRAFSVSVYGHFFSSGMQRRGAEVPRQSQEPTRSKRPISVARVESLVCGSGVARISDVATFSVRRDLERRLGMPFTSEPIAVEGHPRNWEQIFCTWIKARLLVWVLLLIFRYLVRARSSLFWSFARRQNFVSNSDQQF